MSAFRWVPPLAEGLVRDLRLRRALDEAGLAYGQSKGPRLICFLPRPSGSDFAQFFTHDTT